MPKKHIVKLVEVNSLVETLVSAHAEKVRIEDDFNAAKDALLAAVKKKPGTYACNAGKVTITKVSDGFRLDGQVVRDKIGEAALKKMGALTYCAAKTQVKVSHAPAQAKKQAKAA